MTLDERENAGAPLLSVPPLEDLGDQNWRVRQFAVDCLVRESSPATISHVVAIIRDDHRHLARLNAAIQVLYRTDVDVLPQLLPLLASADADSRAYVALTLGERGDARAIPALLAALADPDTNVRVHAIEALGKLRSAAAVDSLIHFVNERNFDLAFPALQALRAIQDQRVAHQIVPLLDSPLFQDAAIDALGVLGDEEAVVPLLTSISARRAPPGSVALSLQQIFNRRMLRYGNGESVIELVRSMTYPDFVLHLHRSIAASKPQEAVAIVAVLGWLARPEAAAALLDLLAHPDASRASLEALSARGTAIVPAILERLEQSAIQPPPGLLELCGRVADRNLVPVLLQLLRSDDEETVAQTLDALARIGDSRAYAPAVPLLGHRHRKVRQAAVNVMNSLGDPRTAKDMHRLLKGSDFLACEAALRVAASFAFDECIEPILDCCNHADERVRQTAIEHLPCLDDARVVERLHAALQSEAQVIRAASARALGEVDPRDALPLLQRALGDRDVWVRYYAARSAAHFNHLPELSQLLLALAGSDPAPQVRIAAIDALKAEALPELVRFAGGTDDDESVAALRVLGAVGHGSALAAVQRAAASSSPRRQLEAIRALGALGMSEGSECLRPLALGRDPELAEESILALGRIPSPESRATLLEILGIPSKRDAAVKALSQHGEQFVATIGNNFKHLALEVRRAAVEVLIRIGSSQAIDVLELALNDPEPAVRFASLSALANLSRSSRRKPEMVGSEGDA